MRQVREFLLLFGIVALASAARATTFTVTTTADGGMGSLREAITSANMNVNVVDRIEFAIAGPSFTIRPLSALPTITDPVTIDGYTQPGTAPNGAMFLQTDAELLIEIDGSLAGDTDGLLIEHLTNLGARTTIRGLVINRFASTMRAAIRINDDGNNLIEGNFIGTDVNGLIARPNFDGVSIEADAAGNLIGGTTVAARNLISGNSNRGVVLNTADNTVQGNLIGTDRTGQVGLGNGAGIVLFAFATDTLIGGEFGLFAVGRNLISGNAAGGIIIGTGALRTEIDNNLIGTDMFGLTTLGNGTGPAIQVGGSVTTITENSIAGFSSGISIGAVTDTVVQRNLIGLGNATNSGPAIIIVDGSNNLIGGTIADGNVISNNGAGVQVVRFNSAANGNAILTNSIFDNDGPGIELINGANNGQPAPVLFSASGFNHVIGALTAAPGTTYQIQFFASGRCDASRHGEGETFLGELSADTDGGGQLPFDQNFAATPGRSVITATATDPLGNTSEFSNCVTNPAAVVAQAPALQPIGLAAALLLLVAVAARALTAVQASSRK